MNELLTNGGGVAIKASAQGQVSGYLVLFSDAAQPDNAGDFFTAQTDFDMPSGVKSSPMYYHHGLDPAYKRRKIGTAQLEIKADGVWLEGQLDMNNPKVTALVGQELGLSSGTAAHLVERERKGNAQWIKNWPLGLDASLTPTPAEPRTISTVAIKADFTDNETDDSVTNEGTLETADAVSEPPAALEPATKADNQPEDEHNTLGGVNMTPEEMQAAIVAGIKAAVDPLQNQLTAMESAMKAAPAQAQPVLVPAEIKAHSDEETRKAAFIGYLKRGFSGLQDGLKTALVEGTGANGGYLVPTGYSNEIITAMNEQSILRQAGARILKIAGAYPYKMPSITNSTAAVKTAENAAFSEVEPTFGEITFTPIKYTKLILVSQELLADARLPIENMLFADAAVAFAKEENTDFTTGDGSGDPQGVVVGVSKGADAAVSALAITDLFELHDGLDHLYRKNAVWMMTDTTMGLVRQLKDGSNRYFLQYNLADGFPATLFGRPVITNNSMAEVGVSSKSILFFDPAFFAIADFGELEVMRLDELYAASGQIGFRWFKRHDSRVLLSAAVKHLLQAAS